MTQFGIKEKRVLTARFVFGYMLLFLLFRYFMKATPSNLLQPSLIYLSFDFTYWLYQLLHLPSLIVQNQFGSIVFDSLLLLTGLLCFLFRYGTVFPFCLQFYS
jgi:hypothetical protein